jgi:uncharacterized membrane protein
MMTCTLCKGDFQDKEKAYRVAHGTVHFSVPSFTVETTSAYYHEKCWQKLNLPQDAADTGRRS